MDENLPTTRDLLDNSEASYSQLNGLVLSGKIKVVKRIAGRRLYAPSTLSFIKRWLRKQEERKA